MKPLRTQ